MSTSDPSFSASSCGQNQLHHSRQQYIIQHSRGMIMQLVPACVVVCPFELKIPHQACAESAEGVSSPHLRVPRGENLYTAGAFCPGVQGLPFCIVSTDTVFLAIFIERRETLK